MFGFEVHFIKILGNITNYIFAPVDSLLDKLPLADFVKDALIDSVHMIPFLLFIFFIIEFLEYYFGNKINEKIKNSAKVGPLFGSLFACIPQCGFSVVASTLYTRKFLTMGTLIAVYISTSDEAIPVILAQPEQVHLVFKILIIKVIIAVIAGYFIDIAIKRYNNKLKKELSIENDGGTAIIESPKIVEKNKEIDIESDDIDETEGCCGHHLNADKNKIELFMHPLTHTAKVTLFVFLVTLLINYIIFNAGGEENLGKIFLQHSLFQPIITAFIGLIPNCAASVAITLMYLKGGIGFGSMISGLCASGGLGMLILLRDNDNFKDTLIIIGLLLGISIMFGILIQYFYN